MTMQHPSGREMKCILIDFFSSSRFLLVFHILSSEVHGREIENDYFQNMLSRDTAHLILCYRKTRAS